ncbi:MAG: nucleotide exchange factor GrpE [Solirubrobacterales bacterium]
MAPDPEGIQGSAEPGPEGAPDLAAAAPPPAPEAGDGADPPLGTEEAAAEEVERDFDALLDETRRERDSYLELAQRTKADFENYRRRMAAEGQAAATRGRADLAAEMIGVLDNLERAIEAAGLDPGAVLRGEVDTPQSPLEQGCLLTYRDSVAALGRGGVEAYSPLGEQFDPSWHEALQKRHEEGAEPGRVVEVLQKGYRLGETVLRPARVVVSE